MADASGMTGAPAGGRGRFDRAVILFDGVCNLCNGAVVWIIRHDRESAFAFASLQSEAAARALADAGMAGADLESIVVIDSQGAHTKSAAAIRIARRLGFPWSLAVIGLALPRVMRDGLYDWVARNRYRWFGRQNACTTPTPELRERFLDAEEARASRR